MAGLRISDQAMLRFLERAGGFDTEALRAQLEQSLARAHAAAAAIGAGDYLIKSDGLTFVVRDSTVTSCFYDLAPHSRHAALKRPEGGGQ